MASSAAILLSRQALRPCRTNVWVEQTVKAVNWLKEKRLTLCTSSGMQTWELLTALGSTYNLNLRLFILTKDENDFDAQKEFLNSQFGLNSDKTEFIPLFTRRQKPSKPAMMHYRDQCIINCADILLPISIRKDGQLESLLDQYAAGTKKIIAQFRTEYETRKKPLSYKIQPHQLNPELSNVGQRFLIHWTRTFNSAWPTERLLDFYQAIVKSDRYPRSAFDSLINIASGKIIKASARHIQDNIPTVSFSSLAPSEMTGLIKWRARYLQMSFEPYGIGIKKELAGELGIHPVKYYIKADNIFKKTGDTRKSPGETGWLRQSNGEKTSWGKEQEYRHKGDLALKNIPPGKMILICQTADEARQITKHTGITALSFISGAVTK